MPQITAPDGSTQYIPGVYTDVRVRSSLPGPLPEFQIPVLMASAWEGVPYNYDTLKEDIEPASGGFLPMGTDSAVSEEYGPESDLHRAMRFAKRHGLPSAYVVSLSALTRASVVVTSTGPVNEFTLLPKSFGAIRGHIKVKMDATSIEFTPVKNYTPLAAAAAGGDTRLQVAHNGWIREGMEVVIGANDVANTTHTVDRVIEELGADGRPEFYIELTAAVGAALAMGQYPVVLEYDEQSKESFAPASGGAQDVIDAITENSQLMLASKHLDFSGSAILPQAVAAALKDSATWATPVGGTSPAAAAADVTAFIAQMNSGAWEAFALKYQVLPQAYLLSMADSTAHLSMRDYAIAERNRGFPISVTVGTEWGDTDLAAVDDTNPTVRAGALNSQDVALCVGGMDGEPAFISYAAAVWGRRMEGGIKHNLTNDELLYSTLEVQWDEINSAELTALHKAGCVAYRLGTFGAFRFLISQGLNTVQDNGGLIWNEVTKQTWSLTPRDIVDFVDRVLKEDLNRSQVGADETTAQSIAQVLVRRAEKSLINRGILTEHRIDTITVNEGGSGFDVEQSYKTAQLVDYITVLSNIVIGE
jgi:hypothetical protein